MSLPRVLFELIAHGPAAQLLWLADPAAQRILQGGVKQAIVIQFGALS